MILRIILVKNNNWLIPGDAVEWDSALGYFSEFSNLGQGLLITWNDWENV